MVKLLFLDTETTGLSADDRLCQLAYKIEDTVVNELFNPGVDIGVGAMAVHHITNEQVADKPRFKDSSHYQALKSLLESDDVILVAHNAPFDVGMIEREGLKVKKFICTLKLARYLLKDDPAFDKYSLQHLRYGYGITHEAIAHDAFGDIVILEEVFDRLYTKALRDAAAKGAAIGVVYNQQSILDRTLALSMNKFTLIKTMNFGKHEGKQLVDLIKTEPGYIDWVLNKMEPSAKTADAVHSIKYLLTKHAK